MAGGRSVGCGTCRQRKIKCDERWPKCLHCEKSARQCEEWQGKLEFVYHYQAVEKQRFVPCRRTVSLNGVRLISSSQQPTDMIANTARQNLLHTSCSLGSASSAKLLTSSSLGLCARLVKSLETTRGTGLNPLYLGEYFQELPARLGHDDCLDAAVECFWIAHQGLCQSRPFDDRLFAHYYSRALVLLRECLDHTSPQQVRANILCSALILCGCEALNPYTNIRPYLAHAGGAIAILDAWGPDRIKSRFELQLFYAHVPSIVYMSLISGSYFPIDEPKWLRLIDKIPVSWTEDRLEANILHLYSKIPRFFREIRKLQYDSMSQIPQKHIASVEKLTHEMCCLRTEVGSVLNKICRKSLNDDGVDTWVSYCLQDIRLGEALCIYWRAVILVWNGLFRIGAEQSLDRDHVLDAVERLCLFSEHAKTLKPFGPLLASFNLKVGASLDSREEREWALALLEEAERNLQDHERRLISDFDTAMDI